MPANGIFPIPRHDRASRIRKLELEIKNKNKDEDVKVVIARFAVKYGLSERTVKEYIKFLKLAKKIDEDVNI